MDYHGVHYGAIVAVLICLPFVLEVSKVVIITVLICLASVLQVSKIAVITVLSCLAFVSGGLNREVVSRW